jgi:hypothetical protein
MRKISKLDHALMLFPCACFVGMFIVCVVLKIRGI